MPAEMKGKDALCYITLWTLCAFRISQEQECPLLAQDVGGRPFLHGSVAEGSRLG